VSVVATMSVIVFGASEGGRRALRRIRADATGEVLAFADNANDRQGGTFEGLPVMAPNAVAERAYDRIVVASHGWRQIVPQLRSLGVPAEKIEVYRLTLLTTPKGGWSMRTSGSGATLCGRTATRSPPVNTVRR
jgi:FlaA1/EpsC-like NDP-sugar epimerase